MTPGNRLHLLVDGHETRDVMVSAIQGARSRVWLETFMLFPDRAGREVLGALEGAARRGVEVVLVVDQAASAVFALGWHRGLERAGAKVFFFNPLLPLGSRGRRSGPRRRRDHRKILITDDTGFCGGHNITSSYLSSGKGTFFDVTLQVEGPCVRDLAGVVVQTLAQTTDYRPGELPSPPAFPDGVPAAVEMMDRRHGIESAAEALREVLHAARQRVYLMLAYFMPEEWMVEVLKATAVRGVDVRLMLVGKTDMPFVRAAANQAYGELLESGVRIYELWEQKLHAKCVLGDEGHLIVGTFDYNRFSAQHSLEVSISALDPRIGAQIEAVFETNLERSRQVTLDAWRERGPLRRLWHRAAFAALDAAVRPKLTRAAFTPEAT